MSDTIDRQAAIDVLTESEKLLKRVRDCTTMNSNLRDQYEWAIKLVESYISGIKDLPPAQTEPIRINLNEPIKVKLTDWGKEIYYHRFDRTNQIAGREICKPRFPREDENGYTEFQLWCFIELYAMRIGITLPNVIEPLEIVYERRTDESD